MLFSYSVFTFQPSASLWPSPCPSLEHVKETKCFHFTLRSLWDWKYLVYHWVVGGGGGSWGWPGGGLGWCWCSCSLITLGAHTDAARCEADSGLKTGWSGQQCSDWSGVRTPTTLTSTRTPLHTASNTREEFHRT